MMSDKEKEEENIKRANHYYDDDDDYEGKGKKERNYSFRTVPSSSNVSNTEAGAAPAPGATCTNDDDAPVNLTTSMLASTSTNTSELDERKNKMINDHSSNDDISSSPSSHRDTHPPPNSLPFVSVPSLSSSPLPCSSSSYCPSSSQVKGHWIGPEFKRVGIAGNDIEKTNVPDLRVQYRHDALINELSCLFIEHNSIDNYLSNKVHGP